MSLLAVIGALVPAVVPAIARAGDRIEVIVTESQQGDGNDSAAIPGTAAPPGSWSTMRSVEVVELPAVTPAPAPTTTPTTWYGLSLGAVIMPLSRGGVLPSSKRPNVNPMRACIGSGEQKACTGLRGADLRLQFYDTPGPGLYPRFIGYVRTGYEAGQGTLAPRGSDGAAPGEATSLAYTSVPVFAGVSVYAFKRFPVRPFVGAGMGADLLRLRYTRREAPPLRDTSARFGVEVHGGIEARIFNYLALTAEVKQQWGMRRKLKDMPDFANTGLTVMAGLAVSLPSLAYGRRDHGVRRVSRVTQVSSTLQPPRAPAHRSNPGGWSAPALSAARLPLLSR